MEKAKQAFSHRRLSSSSSSFTSEVSQENFPISGTSLTIGDNDESNLKREKLLSQTDDLLELGAEGNDIDISYKIR